MSKTRTQRRLWSYVVAHDTGFAPNPDGRHCTLACCKPVIRKCAAPGDWIVGTHSVKIGRGLVCYAMRVDRVILLNAYWQLKEFQNRKDNIYYLTNKGYRQKQNKYHDRTQMDRDLKSRRVLISKHFWYFGNKDIALPKSLNEVIAKRGHKSQFSDKAISSFLSWLKKQGKSGRRGKPRSPVEKCER